ncbi:Uncharacterised protein [Chryseobacterium indologenes]|nr:Uncharacterised protein [Chryseobacterium indologenes]
MVFLLMISCKEKHKTVKIEQKQFITILIQPFKDVSSQSLLTVTEGIKKVYPNVQVLEAIDFPKNTYYKERNRYRADSIIKFLNKRTKMDLLRLV